MHRGVRSFLGGVLSSALLFSFASGNLMAAELESAFDRVWSRATLYKSEAGFVRSIALVGRLQADAATYDADQGTFDDILWRRARLGAKVKFAGHVIGAVEADFDLNESFGDWYTRLTDAYIGWNPSPEVDLRILKHGSPFTLDGATSSTKLLTLQRNNLSNNLWFTDEYFTGVSVAGERDKRWLYRLGVFSTDGDDELSSFNAAFFTLASVGYNWAQALNMKNAQVRVDYVFNDPNVNNSTPDFSNVVSLNTKWEKDRWGVWTDLAFGNGYFGQSNVWGVNLMPFYNISKLLQVVFRYTHLGSEENGIKLNRYENRIVDGRGNEYDEVYGGVNVYIYGHKLKWQTGLQYTKMHDGANDGGEYSGWGLTTGLRLSW